MKYRQNLNFDQKSNNLKKRTLRAFWLARRQQPLALFRVILAAPDWSAPLRELEAFRFRVRQVVVVFSDLMWARVLVQLETGIFIKILI